MSERDGNVVRLPRGPALEPFEPFFVSQMEGRTPKPRDWLLDGVVLRRTVMLLTGAPKIGKSLALQQALSAIAVGDSFLGHQTVRMKCFGLFCEDDQHELERRQHAINAYYGRDPADLELDLSWDSRDSKDAMLCHFTSQQSETPIWTPLWHQILNFVRENGVQVVGFDTVATCFGGNENWRGQTTPFLRGMQRLAAEIDGAVILNAHPNRSNPNSYSGTTAWLASVRAGVSLGRPADYDAETNEPRNIRVLRNLGANYGRGIGVERIAYEDGVFVPADDPEASPKRRAPLSDTERKDLRYRLLEGLRRVLANGAKVPADELSPGSLPRRARASTDQLLNKVALNDLNRAQADLLEAGQVVRVEVAHRCLLRPVDGFSYPGEQPWLPAAGFR